MSFRQLHIKHVITAVLSLMISVLCVAVQTGTVFAEPVEKIENPDAVKNGAYEVVGYDLTAVVDRSHSYKITENIMVSLPDDLDGIRFAMPDGNFRITGLTLDDVDYSAGMENNSRFISITDPDKLTKGNHRYKIDYTIREFADRDTTKDMLYFNVLLPGWAQPITHADIRVLFPDDFPWDDLQYYAGQFGVQDVNTKLDYDADESTHTVTISGDRIPENFGITLKAELPDGYWEGMLDGSWATRFMLLLVATVTLILFILWMLFGRDKKFKTAEQSHPVEGITPVEMGYVFIGRVRIRDIIGLIVYLGIKGYLKISEYAPKKYNLIRLKDPSDPDDSRELSEEPRFIRNAYEMLFEDVSKNRGIDMNDFGPRLRKIKTTIREDIAAGFSDPDMMAYTPISKVMRAIGIILTSVVMGITSALRYSYNYITPNWLESIAVAAFSALALIFLCRQFDRYYYSEEGEFTIRIAAIAACFVGIDVYLTIRTGTLTDQWIGSILMFILFLTCAFLILIMRARGKGNAELTHKFMKLRHFIYHPTAKTMAENIFADSNYYYEIMPYALLFSGLDTWAISFLTVDVPEPEWYSDDIEGNAITNLRKEINVVDYAKDIRTFARTIEDAYHSTKHRDKK